MKKKIVVVLMLLCSLSFSSFAKEVTNINEIIDNLAGLVKTCNDDTLKSTFNFVKAKIDLGEVKLQANKSLERNILIGVEFVFDSAKKAAPAIEYYPQIIETYQKQPSIVYSVLIYNFRQCYDYFTNETFMTSIDNKLEKILFEMDAHYLEGLFIKEVLKKKNFEISPFEAFLVDSLEKDNLKLFAFYIKAVFLDGLYSFTQNTEKPSLEEIIKAYTELGYLIKKNEVISPQDTIEQKYGKLVYINTFVKYIPQAAFDVTGNKTGKTINHKKFKLKKEYPELYKIWNELNKIFNKNSKILNDYNNKVIEEFKKVYENL